MAHRAPLRNAAVATGCAATFVPFAGELSGFASTPVHGDLWITFALFVAAAFAEAGARAGIRFARVAARALGAAALGIAVVNLPTLFERIGRDDGAVARYLAGEAKVHVLWYALAALAGLVLAVVPARVSGAPATPTTTPE